jgi:hypothetical protein
MKWTIKMEDGRVIRVHAHKLESDSGKTDPLLALLHVLNKPVTHKVTHETQTADTDQS